MAQNNTKDGDMVTRVVNFRIDVRSLRPEQIDIMRRNAGTYRLVWNWGLSVVNDYEEKVYAKVLSTSIEQAGGDEDAARDLRKNKKWLGTAYKNARNTIGKRPSSSYLAGEFRRQAKDPSSRFHWYHAEKHHHVAGHNVSEPLRNLDKAISISIKKRAEGKRTKSRRKDGNLDFWPRFQRKPRNGRGKDTFVLYNLAPNGVDPWRIIDRGHRLKLPNVGSIRTMLNTRRLRRLIKRGGIPKSARFTRNGEIWSVSINVSISPDVFAAEARATRRQIANGSVGSDFGVKQLMTLSNGKVYENPRLARRARDELRRLKRRADRQHRAGSLSCFDEQGRHVKGPCPWFGYKDHPSTMSRRARTTQRQIEHVQRLLNARRQNISHQITKELATRYETVCIEDLNVSGMIARPKPKPDGNGGFEKNGRAAKRGLARSISDVGFYRLRQQLEYKTSWYGSRLVVIDRFAPSSKMCSSCGSVKTKLGLDERTFECGYCGLIMDRDLNAAINIRELGMHNVAHPERQQPTDCHPDGVEGWTANHGHRTRDGYCPAETVLVGSIDRATHSATEKPVTGLTPHTNVAPISPPASMSDNAMV